MTLTSSVRFRASNEIKMITYPALERGKHHVRCVQTVHKVGRERGRLLNRVHLGREVRVRDEHGLERGHDLLLLRFAIRLYDRQTKRSGPDDRGHALTGNVFGGRLLDSSHTVRGDGLGDESGGHA